jgi:hypothetical protein
MAFTFLQLGLLSAQDRVHQDPRAVVFRKSPAPRRLQVSTAASGGCLRWKLISHLPPSCDGEREDALEWDFGMTGRMSSLVVSPEENASAGT